MSRQIQQQTLVGQDIIALVMAQHYQLNVLVERYDQLQEPRHYLIAQSVLQVLTALKVQWL